MIRLYYANRLERLGNALANAIAEGANRASPLDPVPIVVPNQATSHYLRIAIAEHNGISANLHFSFLRNFLADLVDRTLGIHVLDDEHLAMRIVAALYDDTLLGSPDLASVRQYLDAAKEDDIDRDRRRLQLATQLGRLFESYALERPDHLERWRRSSATRSTEVWQRALFLAVSDPDGDRPSLAEAFARIDTLPDLPRAIHLFDISVTSPVLLSIVERLAERTEVHLYALNPCLEYWEDVSRMGADALERRISGASLEPAPDDPFGLLADTDTPALRLWGRPGRESVRMLDQLSGSQFVSWFEEPRAPTNLLESFAHDVLVRAPERVVTEGSADSSLVLHACPGVRREVEVIAESIWTMVDASRGTDDPIRFNEIAVVLAGRDREMYRPHVEAVFEAHGGIPHHTLDVPLAGSSRVIEAIELLCALPFSRFTRQDLLRLVTHPAVLATQSDPNADEWTTWCEALLVVHGADRSDHAGTYIERDLYNWDQGLKRLVLGTFMAGARSGDRRAFRVNGQDYLPHEVPASRVASAARFLALVRSLIADARFAETERLTVAAWSEFLHALVTTYVGASTEEEERDLLRALGAIHGLRSLDVDGLRVSFAAAAELLGSRLSAMTTNTGRPLARGVVIAPLSLAYALPFRVVFMPGLGEGQFPAPESTSALDLFSDDRRPGQVTPRQRDQYWFLLRLLATKEAAHLSWVAKSQETGEDLEPAPTIVEFIHLLERSYVGPIEPLITTHPLRRYDAADERHPFAALGARRERAARKLREDLVQYLGTRSFPELGTLRTKLTEETERGLVNRLRLIVPPPSSGDDSQATVQLSLYDLARFLETPLSGWARVVLRLQDDDLDDDPFAREDERFGTPPRLRDRYLRAVFLEAVRTDIKQLERIYEVRADYLELLGDLPTGVFGTADRKRHLETLRHWKKELRRVMRGRSGGIDPIRFGRAAEHEVVTRAEPAIEVGIPDRTVTLYGATQALAEAPSTSMIFVGRDEKGRDRDRRLELRGFVDQVVLAATERHVGDHGVHVAFASGEPRSTRFEAFTGEEARAYLSRVVGSLLGEHHAYALTFETAVALRKAKRRGRRAMERVLDDAKPDPYGPLRAANIRAPELDRALEMIDERLGPYFLRRKDED